MDFKYQVVEPNDNPLEAVIEKTGGSHTFTLIDVQNNLVMAKQKMKELTSMIGVAKAKMENVKGTHPHIAEMSLEDLAAAFIYREAMGTVNEAEKQLKIWEDAFNEDSAQLDEALKQTGLTLPEELKKETE